MKYTWFILLLAASSMGARAADPALILWYDQPATSWEKEALPIGNAHMGAMLFGGVERERIQFNEESLWIGDEDVTGAYQAFGDVFVQWGEEIADATGTTHAATSYRRELDIARAVQTTTYELDGVRYRREAFASYPAKVLVFRFTSDTPGALNGTITMTDAHDAAIVAAGDRLVAAGSLAGRTYKDDKPYALALDYEAQVAIRHEGGALEVDGDRLVIRNADAVTLFLAAATDFLQDRTKGWRGEPPHPKVKARIDAALRRSYDDLLTEHVHDYQALFNRVRIDLGPDGDTSRPTDVRLAAFRRTGEGATGMEELLFNYGRYLMISASRPGSLPANLQGKWCESINPIWRCDYHTDVNIQMIYWPAKVANLAECFLPVAEWVDSIRAVRTDATRKEFKRRGWLVRLELGLFGGSNWSWSLGSTAWILQSVYDYYRFTGDLDYLRNRAYPAMKEVCEYAVDSLEPREDGYLITPKSRSPEHGPAVQGVSYDQQMVWDLFTATMEASEALDVDPDFRVQLADLRTKLLPPKVGRWGQLQEWMDDIDEPTNKHRHISHLVGLFPGRQISPTLTPELAEAAKVTLNARGDVNTGWSTAKKMLLWARLLDSERALVLGRQLLRACVLPNMLATHPPFQIDGNFGYVAGVCEMLLQSHLDEIHLLPALPEAWAAEGHVQGLRSRGGFTVDLAWKDGLLLKGTIQAQASRPCQLRANTPFTVDGIPSRLDNGTHVLMFAATRGVTYSVKATGADRSVP